MLFKNVDEKFKEIGFNKICDDEYCVTYKRYNKKYNYEHELTLLHKSSGKHIVQSSDPNLSDNKNIGNTCVGLTSYELKLIYKKLKEKKWLSGKRISKKNIDTSYYDRKENE